MDAHKKQYGLVVLLFLMISCLLWNCGDKKEAMKAPIVSKKIAAQKAITPKSETRSSKPADEIGQSSASKGIGAEKSAGVSRIYDPEKRIDPFSPLFKAEKPVADVEDPVVGAPKKRRIPKTPLEKIGLDQLKLVATIRAPSGNKGLVEDGKGKGYIVKKGTYIGLNSGIVTHVSSDRVRIEQEVEDLMGKRVLQNTEMKLQKPAGE